ncbi:MAG: O-antigen ligase family protein [Bdellovibrionota bacterium]
MPAVFFILSRKQIPAYFIKIGGVFIFLHVIFPIVNFLIYFFPNASISPSIYKIALQWPGILQSNFPSSLFFGGLLIILLTLASRRVVLSTPLRVVEQDFQPLKYFISGLVLASVLFTCLMLYGHTTGIDFHSLFRKKLGYVSNNDHFKSGGYRVYGFYGHPLTISGVCLAYAIFSWTLLCSFLSNKKTWSWNFLPYNEHKFLPIFFLFVITFANEVCLLISGGRTAAIVGLILLVVIPLFFNLRKNFLATSITVVIICVASFFMAKKLGILSRIETVATSISKRDKLDGGNYRSYFWKTYKQMFLDKPLVGQGNYWLKQGAREEYYNKLGYAELPQKYVAHNVYLEILGTTGLLGFIWISAGIIYLFRTMKKYVFTEESSLKPVGSALLFAFIANLLHGFTQNVYFDSSVVYIYICLIVVVMWSGKTDAA